MTDGPDSVGLIPVSTGTDDSKAILFTSFEPSGDDHASSVVRELLARRPELKIYAWGGPKMRRAGAEVIETTGEDAVVGMPGIEKIRQHLELNKRIRAWLGDHPEATLHVPVDSPAANFPICKIAQKLGRTVVHLVAPQLWAWGPWRVGKLRRCTDLVLCLLPFEETFFEKRGVPARFIGHPLFDEALDPHTLDDHAAQFPRGTHKLALLPGSRPAELRRNFPVMLSAFRALRKETPGLVGVVGATTETVREHLYQTAKMLGGWPAGLDIEVAKTDAIVRWCDTSMVVSGTVTLQIAKQRRPMVVMYKTNKLMFNLVARWIITTPYFCLPNLIAGREIVPELIPYFKGHDRLVESMRPVMTDGSVREQQQKDLDEVAQKFEGLTAATQAADAIESVFEKA